MTIGSALRPKSKCCSDVSSLLLVLLGGASATVHYALQHRQSQSCKPKFRTLTRYTQFEKVARSQTLSTQENKFVESGVVKMNYFSLFLSQLIMLVIGIASDMSAFLGAVLASAPSGTPLSLYLSTDGKEGLARRTAFLEFTAGSMAGSIGLLAFSFATRCIVLYGGKPYNTNLLWVLSAGFVAYFVCVYVVSKLHIFTTLPSNSDINTIPTRKRT